MLNFSKAKLVVVNINMNIPIRNAGFGLRPTAGGVNGHLKEEAKRRSFNPEK